MTVLDNLGHGWVMAIGILHVLMFWILAILATVALWAWLKKDVSADAKSQQMMQKTPLVILKERYVRGEINQDEFEDKKRHIED